jgi:hypothetical protein
MATNVPAVASVTLQKLVDACIASTKYHSGSAPDAAPSAFKDRAGKTITVTESSEIDITIKVNPGGNSAWVKVVPNSSRAQSIQGEIDLIVLATKLA